MTTSSPEPTLNTDNLSSKETRERVTPYAFGVADELLGQPLASPFRRLFSQCIDVTIVVLLSSAHALVLAFFVAITFFKAGNHLAKGQKRTFARKMLRLSAACLLFFITFVVVESYNKAPPQISQFTADPKVLGLGLGVAQKYAWQACQGEFECQQEVASGFGEAYAETEISYAEVAEKFNEFLADKTLEDSEKTRLFDDFSLAFKQNSPEHILPGIAQNLDADSDADEEPQAESIAETAPKVISEPTLKFGLGKDNNTEKSNSIISWVEGIISDLGLGLGWAALYYSVLTAWWRGHTIGKRMLRIKVVKLDGSELNLWESFGRYGGYTAGIATGLLGFLQIFWDPNRQTIQDKIAETLVLYRPVGSTPIPELINSESTVGNEQ